MRTEVNGRAMTDTGHDPQARGSGSGESEPHGETKPHGPADPHGPAEPHGSGDHAADPGHEHDDHGHMDVPLGPVDWVAWVTGAFGVALGLIMWFCFAFATS
jgi:hypothetical protein